MSVLTTPPAALKLSTVDLQQEQGTESHVPPAFLQFPMEIIFRIGQFVATGATTLEAAKNALKFGNVCSLMYYLKNVGSIATTINLANSQVRKWVVHPTDPCAMNYIDYTGQVLITKRINCHI